MKETKKKRYIGYGAISTFFTLLLTIGLLSSNGKLSLGTFVGGADSSDHSITLNSSNRVTTAGDHVQKTRENNNVTFTYANVASSTSGHVTLNTNGTLVNKDHIYSIESITAEFNNASALKFRVSYDSETWGAYSTMVSGQEYLLGSLPYYVEFLAANSVTINSLVYKYTCIPGDDSTMTHEVAGDTYFQKVTSTPTFNGEEYLIVCEEQGAVFDGFLTTLDDTSNYVSYSLVSGFDDRIQATNNVLAATFTINSNGNILSSSGKYIGNGSDSNGLTASTSALTNSISIGSNGDVDIVSSGGAYLRFNSTSNQMRFRYFKSSTYTNQKAIQLYKKVAAAGGTQYNTPVDIVGFTATDSKANTYKTTDVFDTNNGLYVVANKNDNTIIKLSKGGEDGYSYVVKNSNNVAIDTSLPFGGEQNQTFTLIVSYKNFIPIEIQLTVSFEVVLTGIDVNSTQTIFNTAQKLSDFTNSISVNLTYNRTSDNESNVPYSSFSAKNLTLTLLNPSQVTASINSAFGVAGTWKIRVSSTQFSNVYGELEITVNAILVTQISVSGTSATVEEGKTLQLTANVTPTNATNANVSWSSSNESVATVNTNGLVTGVAAGSARITATAVDGSTVFGFTDITVTAKQVAADEGTFALNTGSIAVGSYVVFSSSGSDGSAYAMSSTQGSNNRAGVGVTISNSKIERESTSTFRAFLVGEGTTSGTYSFYDEAAEGYLYAASSSSNYLRTETTLTANSSFTISSSSNGSRTITAQGSNTRNLLQWNNSSKIFSCYSSGQADTYLFTKAGSVTYPSAIQLTGDSSVYVGSTITLDVSYTPATTTVKTVTWSSSNENVATVSNGVVTGLTSGTTTITARAVAANNGYVEATKTITVNNVAVTSVSLNKTQLQLTVGEHETLQPIFNPENATNKGVTWSSSNESVATVTSAGVVEAIAPSGDNPVTITVRTDDGNKTATCQVTVTASGGSGGGGTITETAEVTMTLGTNASACTVNGSDGVKVGTSSNGGDMSITVPTNAVELELYAAAWNGVSGLSLNITGATVSPSSISLTADSGVSNNSPFTLSGTESSYKFTITLSDIDEETTLTFTTSTNKRCVIWNASCKVNTTPVDPTSISLSPTSFELAPNGTKDLTVTYSQGANHNKEITWSTSNSNVATVDTNGRVTAKNAVGQSATITATLTNIPSIHASATVTVVETQNDDQTILIYMCGSDLESDGQTESSKASGYASKDITEILSVNGQPDDVNVVIETGGAKCWANTHGISSSVLTRFHVENKQLVQDAQLTKANMGLTSTLQSFLTWGLQTYPAERTSLILWNHGGAMRGVCYDENYENSTDYFLTNDEVKSAVSGSFNTVGRSTSNKLEWIGYDACLMAVQDIAEFNSTYFNYMVASEESEAGDGWDYDTWIDDAYNKSATSTILTAVVNGFISATNTQYQQNNWGASDQTLAWFDLSQMSAYKSAWETMATALKPLISNKTSFQTIMKTVKEFGTTVYSWSDIQYYANQNSTTTSQIISAWHLEQSGNYYYDYGYYYYGIFDAYDTLVKLKSNYSSISTQIEAAKTAFNQLVGHSNKGSGAGNAYGICCFFPLTNGGYSCATSTYYSTSKTNFTNWRSIVTTYGD